MPKNFLTSTWNQYYYLEKYWDLHSFQSNCHRNKIGFWKNLHILKPKDLKFSDNTTTLTRAAFNEQLKSGFWLRIGKFLSGSKAP